MSGIIGSKDNIRGSGLVAKLGTDGQILTSTGAGTQAAFEDAAAGISWQAVETGSTMTAVAGNGYPIDTSSNACTITLPASASLGDQIIFTDYARNWGTNAITIDSNGLNYQGDDDSYTVEYSTDGQSVHIVYADATKGWIPITDDAVTDAPSKGNQEGIFAFGRITTGTTYTAISNLLSNVGVVATDTAGVGSERALLAATQYGGDKGIFAYGDKSGRLSLSSLVSNAGVIAADVTGVGTARAYIGAGTYGSTRDKGIFGFGDTGGANTGVSMTNLVSNAGVVATDTTGVGQARGYVAATEFGDDKVIFGYGTNWTVAYSMTNLVSNVGVVATDVTGVGTARYGLKACAYGYDKGIFGFGEYGSYVNTAVTNLVSNAGVVATDTAGVGTIRITPGSCEYGGDKGIFAYGYDDPTHYSLSNLVSNTGVVASDVTGVGTGRYALAACSFN